MSKLLSQCDSPKPSYRPPHRLSQTGRLEAKAAVVVAILPALQRLRGENSATRLAVTPPLDSWCMAGCFDGERASRS